MQRTIPPEGLPEQAPVYPVHEEPIVLSKHLFDLLLAQPHPADLISLYCFYYYTAKWQQTNQPRITSSYIAKGLQWGEDKICAIKQKLKALNLIEDIITRGADNRISGHYVKVNFIWRQKTVNQLLSSTPGILPALAKTGINALSANNINALNNITVHNKKQVKKTSTSKPPMPSLKERTLLYLPLAQQLSDIIRTTKNITHTTQQLMNWANSIRMLVEENNVIYDRVKRRLDWYAIHAGGEYIPVIESGASLRDKFLNLEEAVKRGRRQPVKTVSTTGHREPEKRYKVNKQI
jgi:hypothetical protein